MSPSSSPLHPPTPLRRVALVFAGGPAPAANAVISAVSLSLLDGGVEVVGFLNGYGSLQDYDPAIPLEEDRHYRVLAERDVSRIRNQRGVLIGTGRANPGKTVSCRADLDDPDRTEGLRRVHQAITDLGIDALVSIGGDDTLRTANLLYLYQLGLPEDAARFRIVHVPKTIDNDYRGIDFTFGFFTAVDFMAKEVQNLRADAIATRSWFVVETMGRKAGWLSYGVGIAGEANLVLAVEDLDDSLGPLGDDGSRVLNLDSLADRIVDLVLLREERDDKHYGVVVVAEGLAEHLPDSQLDGVSRDEHGHISLGKLDLGKFLARAASARYRERTGRDRKIKGVQLGYESRTAPPHAFDVMLGSQLGVGACRALVEEGLDGHMVSVSGQLELRYVPFDRLVDSETLVTELRSIEPGSDFHRLARFLETQEDRLG